MNITPDTSFAEVETAQRQRLEREVARCAAQTEAARDLLERAEQGGHLTAFWTRALDFAEGEEAVARRALASWKRDKSGTRRAFFFRRALCAATETRLKKWEAMPV
jgi:hypothetical protein